MTRDQTKKADAGKLRMELIPAEALEALAEVLTYGANKYSANSWQTIDDAVARYSGALMRHYTAFRKDPASVDEESGIEHVKHMFCNAMFLTFFVEQLKKFQ